MGTEADRVNSILQRIATRKYDKNFQECLKDMNDLHSSLNAPNLHPKLLVLCQNLGGLCALTRSCCLELIRREKLETQSRIIMDLGELTLKVNEVVIQKGLQFMDLKLTKLGKCSIKTITDMDYHLFELSDDDFKAEFKAVFIQAYRGADQKYTRDQLQDIWESLKKSEKLDGPQNVYKLMKTLKDTRNVKAHNLDLARLKENYVAGLLDNELIIKGKDYKVEFKQLLSILENSKTREWWQPPNPEESLQ